MREWGFWDQRTVMLYLMCIGCSLNYNDPAASEVGYTDFVLGGPSYPTIAMHFFLDAVEIPIFKTVRTLRSPSSSGYHQPPLGPPVGLSNEFQNMTPATSAVMVTIGPTIIPFLATGRLRLSPAPLKVLYCSVSVVTSYDWEASSWR
jgi:hypothetical protein